MKKNIEDFFSVEDSKIQDLSTAAVNQVLGDSKTINSELVLCAAVASSTLVIREVFKDYHLWMTEKNDESFS